MSTTDIHQRPAFQSLDPELTAHTPTLSLLAVGAVVLGALSLLAAFSTVLLPLSFLAIAIGTLAVWHVSRNDQVSGIWPAQIGLAMAVTSLFWSLTAERSTEDMLATRAGEFAEEFLDTLAAGRIYEALELRRFENTRQLTGTDLEMYYSRMVDEQAEDKEYFLTAPAAVLVKKSGPESDWQFMKLISTSRDQQDTYVKVELANMAGDPDRERVHVTMIRNANLLVDQPDSALWRVDGLSEP